MAALATWAPEDGVLGAVAPLALAATQPTALVVDLDPGGPRYPSERSLRALVEEGPRAADLAPSGRGIAMLANGGIDCAAAAEIVDLLLAGWPAVVLRVPPQVPSEVPAPVVPVRLLVPGRWFPAHGRGVYQPVGGTWRQARRLRAAGSIVLPQAPRRVLAAYLQGARPPVGRWPAAWRRVWEAPW